MFTIAICDAEKAIGEQIEKMIRQVSEEFEDEVQAAVFTSGEELAEYMEQTKVDLLFLNTVLKDMTGIQISYQIRRVEQNEEIQIVYLSDQEGYEKELFNFQPLNFISKPLDVNKVKECIEMTYRKLSRCKKKFRYFSYYEEHFALWNQIISFETEGKNIVINTVWKKERFRSSMNQVESQMTGNSFVQISQSVIVNMEYIAFCDGKKIVLKNGQEYYVSRSKGKIVKQRYMEYVLENRQ